ncbi:hypothetical protein RJ641_000735 [Dillenia turbinata]|uniref:Uncharacterized protein n=1 Tax=Dillenia turbinata TaxID=194707 RepID=A0AAN8WJE5_9MAGN
MQCYRELEELLRERGKSGGPYKSSSSSKVDSFIQFPDKVNGNGMIRFHFVSYEVNDHLSRMEVSRRAWDYPSTMQIEEPTTVEMQSGENAVTGVDPIPEECILSSQSSTTPQDNIEPDNMTYELAWNTVKKLDAWGIDAFQTADHLQMVLLLVVHGTQKNLLNCSGSNGFVKVIAVTIVCFKREKDREALGYGPIKYHGKWPFKRIYGFQVCN